MKLKVVIDGYTYTVEFDDVFGKPVVAKIDGQSFEVWPENGRSVPDVTQPEPPHISVPGADSTSEFMGEMSSEQLTDRVQAPLPGVIVAVMVKPGDQVSRGQELCTLEAMKMKNAIKSSREGIIKTIEVNVGDQVNHGQVLITFID